MKTSKFDFNSFYHIYNRSIGNELLYRFDKDYEYFLKKADRFISSYADIIAYCLIPNHFHLLIKIKDPKDLPAGIRHMEDLPDGRRNHTVDQALKNFFNSYTRSYNNIYERHGRLFQHGYKYKEIKTNQYLIWLIYYIHRNPVHHKLTNTCDKWPYSSYNRIIEEDNKLISKYIFDLYGDKNEFIDFTSDLTLEYKKEFL